MTDQSKIEAAAREQLEELAREVACEKVGQCFSQGTDIMLIARAVKAAKYAYLACHASRDAEIAALRAKLASMREPLWMLREEHEAETADLRARLEVAESRVAVPARLESGPYIHGDDWPGVFIRGDEALGYSMDCAGAITALEHSDRSDPIALMNLGGLMRLLQSCRVSAPVTLPETEP